MITVILCLRPLKLPKFIWFKILYERRFEFGSEMCYSDDIITVYKGSVVARNFKLTEWCFNKIGCSTFDLGMYKLACYRGVMSYIIRTTGYSTPENRIKGFTSACAGNQIAVVKYLTNFIEKDLHKGLDMACYMGHLDIVKFFRKTNIDVNWTSALENACAGEQTAVVKYLLHKRVNVTYECLRTVIKTGNVTLFRTIKFCTDKSCHDAPSAIRSGNLEMLKLVMGGISNNLLLLACELNKPDIVKYLVGLGADDFNGGLISTTSMEIRKFLVSRGANNFNDCLKDCCENGDTEGARFFIKCGADDFTKIINYSRKNNNKELLDLLN